MNYYSFGRLLGHIINLAIRIIKFVCKVYYWGTIKICRRYKAIIGVYAILLIAGIIAVCTYKPQLTSIGMMPVYYVSGLQILWSLCNTLIWIFALIEYIKEYPFIKQKKMFNQMFMEIKLYNIEEKTGACIIPEYLEERSVSEFLNVLTFYTITPLEHWKKKKELLEMYTNIKILDIEQDRKNLRIMRLLVQIKSLPTMIEWNDKYFVDAGGNLAIGIGVYGLVTLNLQHHAHTLIAGETGAGKSNVMKCLIHQAILNEYDVKLIDFKRGVSFSQFPLDIYYEYDTASRLLQDMVNETKLRLDKFRECQVDNIEDFNAINSDSRLTRIIIFVDELAELLKHRDKDVSNAINDSIETLTRLSRAAGIHLIMGIQRPDSTVVSGQIKNNVSYRICGRFVDKEPSRIMLSCDAASRLENIKGRFIIKDDELQEVQSFYFDSNNFNYGALKKQSLPLKAIFEPEKEETPLTSESALNFDFSDIKHKEK